MGAMPQIFSKDKCAVHVRKDVTSTVRPLGGGLDISSRRDGDNQDEVDQSLEEPLTPKKKARKATSFLSRLQLGSLQQVPQPGDVYHGPMSVKPRPLGLLPHHNDRLAALKKLNQLLSPWSPLGYNRTFHEVITRPPDTSAVATSEPTGDSAAVESISATVHLVNTATHHTKLASLGCSKRASIAESTAYRLPHKALCEQAIAVKSVVIGDPDYMGDKANEYYALIGSAPLPTPRMSLQQRIVQPTAGNSQKGDKKKAKMKRHFHAPVSKVGYLNFTEQAQLYQRSLTDGRREALAYEPCERCRLRGGRCARCKALRTGGGYIILDGGEEPDLLFNRRKGLDFRWSGGVHSDGEGGGQRLKRVGKLVMEGSDRGLVGGERESGQDSSSRAGRSGGRLEGRGSERGWSGGDGDSGRGGEGREGEITGTQAQRNFGKGKDGGWSGGDGNAGGTDGLGRRGSANKGPPQHSRGIGGDSDTTDRGGGDHGGEQSGRQSHASRPGSVLGRSRPGSTLGTRPGSSLRQPGRGGERSRRNRTTGDMEGGHGRSRQGREAGDESDHRERSRVGRRSSAGGHGRQSSEAGDRDRIPKDYQGFEYNRDEEDEDSGGYHGNLMKFKKRQDNVKALHATMRELQGIDPLDYLARYCIIDQTKVPHYQHVFNNVDRDEDDEIDIGELDFALKAVNYDLISDAEMNYVHSVLELAGRYKLNFRLFSLIAALSEKVVALEDMVKRLINKMDFDALAVKMKKCKELFYLLADSDAALEHEGGVVTSSSLAVELQAGGLTQEHVVFVVDRLNYEGKGLVEFLDYLTYVPLFVEIHDSISGNPLDFSRTK